MLSVGPNSTSSRGNSSSAVNGGYYNIKFTFMPGPLHDNLKQSSKVASKATSQVSTSAFAQQTAASAATEPTGGVQRVESGELGDGAVKGKAEEAFIELVARMYFNIVTAALGNECNAG